MRGIMRYTCSSTATCCCVLAARQKPTLESDLMQMVVKEVMCKHAFVRLLTLSLDTVLTDMKIACILYF